MTTPPQAPEVRNHHDGISIKDQEGFQNNLEPSFVTIDEAEESSLIGVSVETENEAYQLYNSYAGTIGFGTRYHNIRYVYGTDKVKSREFVCSKHGYKKETNANDKKYTKLDGRTGCLAKVFFEIDADGKWVVRRHDMTHNHTFCPQDGVHLLKTHRNVSPSQLDLLKKLVDSRVHVVDAIRFMRNDAGGNDLLGFTSRDAYNALAVEKKKKIDGSDAQNLLNMFKRRQENEPDFYYDFQLDPEDCSLISFFWRDGKMKQDYMLFGGLVIHDTTHRTNRYDLVCGPFTGVNHNTDNCMFGCGFLLNEKIESFVWLFTTFLKSMDNVQPQTIMTDQDPSMAPAIKKVFPESHHRLCCWHISENSKKKIQHLRNKPRFVDVFNYVLMYCDTVEEFEYFWKRMTEDYECTGNKWLKRIYKKKAQWCPAFSKHRFSAGILSSQRSESTNHSINRKLHKATSLVGFYDWFCVVVFEWRNNEYAENTRCWEGFPQTALNTDILTHVVRIYRFLVLYSYLKK